MSVPPQRTFFDELWTKKQAYGGRESRAGGCFTWFGEFLKHKTILKCHFQVVLPRDF